MSAKHPKLDNLLLFLGISILPIYIFDSGGVQPSHALLALFSAIALSRRRFRLPDWSAILLVLFAYSLLIECVYMLTGGKPQFIINSIFFLYNFIFVCGVYHHVQHNGISTITPGIFIAAAIALTSVLISGTVLYENSESDRATGSFNNPNQLGYFSVCLLSLSYLLYRCGNIRYWLAAALFCVALFMAVSSLSKAAMAANFIVIAMALKPKSSRKLVAIWLVSATTAMGVVFLKLQSGALDEFAFIDRLMNMASENDSSMEARGYFALVEGDPLQLLLGLGSEGVHDIVGHEVHSTFGSVLNNYGLLGFLLFATVYLIWCVRIWQFFGFASWVCIVGPSTLYGLTHNGIRFTIFWLLFSASLGMIQFSRSQREHQSVHSVPLRGAGLSELARAGRRPHGPRGRSQGDQPRDPLLLHRFPAPSS